MKIVAFLQNPWFKPETPMRVIERYRDDQRFHRAILLRCMTGQRLFTAFGEYFNMIHWDNTNWRPSWRPSGIVPPDYEHIATVLTREIPPGDPDHRVICFGKQAEEALNCGKFVGYNVLACHHPNARHKTQADLNDFACRVLSLALHGIPYEKKSA